MEARKYTGVVKTLLVKTGKKRSLVALITILSLTAAAASTFTVSNTADTGAGSLRQAIMDSNANPPPANTTNLIQFNIGGTGVHTITLASSLPNITQPVTIDGYTQSGASANTLALGDNAAIRIKIDGDMANPIMTLCNAPECGTTSDGSTIRGLCFAQPTASGAMLSVESNNNHVTGNFFGVDTDGVTLVGANDIPIEVTRVVTPATGNIIGGTAPAARNVIACNGAWMLLNDGDNTLVQGNYFGTNKNGTATLGSGQVAIDVEQGNGVIIGGSASGAGNVINAASSGIVIGGVCFNCVTSTTVEGNLIGIDATGTVAFSALFLGVNIGQSVNTTIGGNIPGAGNVINARGDGIFIGSVTGIVIQGNKIGTDITGTMPLGNGNAGIDVGVLSGASTTSGTIGGTGAGEGNIIAFNGTNGVEIGSGNTGWSILGNSVFSNAGLGIDLNADGVTLNDTGDGDTGGNNLQNFPVIASVSSSGGMTTITGTLNSTPNTMYRVEFFANDAIDPTGYGEGQVFLGFKNVTTDASGNIAFNAAFSQIGAGQRVTATATDPAGNTSEFSAAIGQLLNISTRLNVQTGAKVLIGGFIINGSQSKSILVRALGPTLAQPPFSLSGVLGDPTLALYQGATQLATNDNWADTQQSEINATGKAPPNAAESAILQPLAPDAYTAILSGKNATTGVGLVEVYDLTPDSNSTLANISTRGFVETGSNLMIGGFIVKNGIQKVIVRALGPTLGQPPFNVPEVLADPVLTIFDANGQQIASNDNWKDTQQAEIQATGKAPPNDSESAIIITRPPGNTTAILSGKNNTTGNALVEVYILPP
jgi:hypothetical protein